MREMRIRAGKARPEDLQASAAVPEEETTVETLTEGQLWVWGMFDRLSRSRGFNEGGAQPLRYAEIAAFFEIHQVSEEPQEALADVFMQMDVVWLKRHRDRVKAEMEKSAQERERERNSKK